jgi:Protein of unknown function (DUF3611)
MFRAVKSALKPSQSRSLAMTFSRLGWLGFWMQIGIGAVPVALTLYSLIFTRSSGAGTRAGFAIIEYLTIGSLLVLAFTTIWFYRYTRLASRIADPQRRPSQYAVQRVAWTGVAASTLGIVFSMLIMTLEVAQLLFYFLRAPQAGVPVVQTTGGGPASWVSAADIVSLLVLIVTTFIEVAVLALSLWLLCRALVASAEYPGADAGEEPALA